MTAFSPHQALQEQLTSAVQEIGHLIDPIATAARGEAAQLGHKVMCTQGLLRRMLVSEGGGGGEVFIDAVTVPKTLVPALVPGPCWLQGWKTALSLPLAPPPKMFPSGSLFTWCRDKNSRELSLVVVRLFRP